MSKTPPEHDPRPSTFETRVMCVFQQSNHVRISSDAKELVARRIAEDTAALEVLAAARGVVAHWRGRDCDADWIRPLKAAITKAGG